MSQSTPLPPLQRITALLGEPLFPVPTIPGSKKPVCTYVERSMESVTGVPYRSLFEDETRGIAIYLGEASGGLCAIDFDVDEDVEVFLAVNPQMAGTTRTRGSRGAVLWVRIKGEFPTSCRAEHFEWRANRNLAMIHGLHPKGMRYQFLIEAPPVTIEFVEIVWPDGWKKPWESSPGEQIIDELTHTYGRPFRELEKGEIVAINERFWAALYARENSVIFEPGEDSFYRYNDETGRWGLLGRELVKEGIGARILEASRQMRKPGLAWFVKNSVLTNITTLLCGIVSRAGVFAHKRPFIHVANGIVRYRDASLILDGFSPDDYSRNQSPYDFDPAAQCPRFLDELILPAVSADDASLLQRWAGLVLFGYNLPQRFLIMDGTPGGGKGTFVRIIQSLVGQENTQQLRTECLHDRFETYRYRGKTLLIGPDVAGDFLMQKGASVLKMLVGGDPLFAERKSSNGDFPMHGTFNLVVNCNSHLRVRLDGDVGAWRRRLLIVRYENPPPKKKIPDFHQQLLKEEGNGILRWALGGFARLQQELEQTGDFALTEPQLSIINSLLAESDSLRLFVQQGMERHNYGTVTNGELTQGYARFCAEHSWNALPITIVERLASELMLEVWQVAKSNSIERDGRKSNRGWRGVRLLNEGTSDEP